MNSVIEKYYTDNNIPNILLSGKLKKFEKHNDIASEFEYWITNHTYKGKNAVSVEGYTAERLSELSDYLKGEGAFLMLIELRENPTKALITISKGFKRK